MFIHYLRTVHGTHNHFIQKKNIKNGSHGTIYTFKNYFATVFFSFQFQFSIFNCIQTEPQPRLKITAMHILFWYFIITGNPPILNIYLFKVKTTIKYFHNHFLCLLYVEICIRKPFYVRVQIKPMLYLLQGKESFPFKQVFMV